jgi:uracil-DNA glycosylase family 4
MPGQPTKLGGLAYGRPPGNYYHGPLSQLDCASCPLRYDRKVYPDGPVPARIAFVGEEPGQRETIEGRGFVGPSGQLLWKLAKAAGIDRNEVWVTNAALCPARSVRLDTGAVIPQMTVKATAGKCCRERLLTELAMVDPVVIVPLGNWALWSIADIPKAKIYAYRGSRIDVDIEEVLQRVKLGVARTPMREVKNP